MGSLGITFVARQLVVEPLGYEGMRMKECQTATAPCLIIGGVYDVLKLLLYSVLVLLLAHWLNDITAAVSGELTAT
jgi:hypothetical protein